ncbi:hypothetical protein [Pseudactinotalea sp.]|uniref:hypothetical protein n=1 Tax=Pseudactinotalea sp. TaxID=1926260 RepID=UPI003B3BBBEE
MGRGTRRSVLHTRELEDGSRGCYIYGCRAVATRWISMHRFGQADWLKTSYCQNHGDGSLYDPCHSHRVTPASGAGAPVVSAQTMRALRRERMVLSVVAESPDGTTVSGVVIGMGSRLCVQIPDGGGLVEDIRPETVRELEVRP